MSAPSEPIEIAKVVDLDYNDLVNDVDLTDKIAEAYGPEGLGLLTVSNVPNVMEYRQAILPLAYKFANLPDEIKNKYVHEKSNFSFGWSHGKEKFNGKVRGLCVNSMCMIYIENISCFELQKLDVFNNMHHMTECIIAD